MTISPFPSPLEKRKPSFYYGYAVVASCFLVMVVVWGIFYSFGVFFKPVLAEFGWNRAMTSGAYSLAMLLSGVLGIYVGGLNDRFGPKVVMASCGVLFGLGYLLMARINSLWELYLFYGVIIALGMSGSFAPLVSTVTRWFTRRRGIMTGIVVSGIGIGNVFIPPLASKLISAYEWRTSFAIFGIASLVLIPLAAYFMKRDPSQLGQLPYGESRVAHHSPAGQADGLSLREAIRTKPFWMLALSFFSYGFNVQATMVHIVPRATDIGIPAGTASGLIAIIGGVSIFGRMATGIASDRIGSRACLVGNFAIMAFAMFWLAASSELWMFYLFSVVFGLAYGGLAIMNPVVSAELFGLRAHGAIVGMVAFGFQTGGAVGPLLAGHVFDLTASYYLAFLVSGALGIAGILLVLLLKPAVRKHSTEIHAR